MQGFLKIVRVGAKHAKKNSYWFIDQSTILQFVLDVTSIVITMIMVLYTTMLIKKGMK